MSIEVISTPARNLSLNNVSYWGAAFNPQVFLFQRKDFEIVEINELTPTRIGIKAKHKLTDDEALLMYSGLMMVRTNAYNFNAVPAIISTVPVPGDFTIYEFDVPYVSTPFVAGGFMNSTGLRPGYKIQVLLMISGQTITARYTPDAEGACRADLQAYLKAFTNSDDNANYNVFSWLDESRFEQYAVSVSEFFNNEATEPVDINSDFYVTHSALQFNKYGSNMAPYVPFLYEPNYYKRARFLTDIKQPVFTPGFPMDISFIMNGELSGNTILCRYTTLDINKNPISGLEDNELLINTIDSLLINAVDALLISKPAYDFEVGNDAGVWRMPIIDSLSDDVAFIEVFLYYIAAATETTPAQAILITEIKTIEVNRGACKSGVYVKWLNLLGGWDYQLFEYRAEYSIEVSQAYVDRLVLDYSTQNTTQDVLSKTGVNKIKVGKEGASVEQMKGFAGLLTSTKAYMLLDKDSPQDWQTVIVDSKGATLYDTKDWFGDFEVTLKLPALNIQTA